MEIILTWYCFSTDTYYMSREEAKKVEKHPKPQYFLRAKLEGGGIRHFPLTPAQTEPTIR